MPFFGEKPFTSITVKVNHLCTVDRNSDLADDSAELYIEDLIALIKPQSSGASEAARAIRKQIKYGSSAAESVLALNLLELLVLNAGPKIGPTIASDDKLYDLLKGVVSGQGRSGSGGPYDASIVKKARALAYGWKDEFKDMMGYQNLSFLYKYVPKDNGETKVKSPFSNSAEFTQMSSPPPPRPVTDSPYAMKPSLNRLVKPSYTEQKHEDEIIYADEQYQIPQINYKAEAPKIRSVISKCHTHTTALENALLAVPRETNPMNDSKVAAEFEKCREIRRNVLRYLQYVGAGASANKPPQVVALDEEFLGCLIVANDQLVSAFKKFDKLCGFTDENPAQYHQDDENYEAASRVTGGPLDQQN